MYGITPWALRLVKQSVDRTYQCVCGDDTRLAIRVGNPERHTPGTLEAAYAWFADVSQALPGRVASPVASTEGRLATEVTLYTPGLGAQCKVILAALEWCPGKTTDRWCESDIRGLGETIGVLHSRSSSVPEGCSEARRWSAEGFSEFCGLEYPQLSRIGGPPLVNAYDRIMSAMKRLKWSDTFIHGDLASVNALRSDSAVTLIDCGHSGLGSVAYDLGGLLASLMIGSDDRGRRAMLALREGYLESGSDLQVSLGPDPLEMVQARFLRMLGVLLNTASYRTYDSSILRRRISELSRLLQLDPVTAHRLQ